MLLFCDRLRMLRGSFLHHLYGSSVVLLVSTAQIVRECHPRIFEYHAVDTSGWLFFFRTASCSPRATAYSPRNQVQARKSSRNDGETGECKKHGTYESAWSIIRFGPENVPLHYGRKLPRIQTEVLGHSLVRSLVRSHCSLVRSLAHFAHSLARGTVND